MSSCLCIHRVDFCSWFEKQYIKLKIVNTYLYLIVVNNNLLFIISFNHAIFKDFI